MIRISVLGLFLTVCLLLLIIGYVVGAVVHARQAAARTEALVQVASQFPHQYTVGSGPPLRYLMLGDSTALGVGCQTVQQTVAYQNAILLGAGHTVEVTNMGVSGARLNDVVTKQLPELSGHYDVATVLVGANDATHLTTNQSFWGDLETLVTVLTSKGEKIILVTPPNFFGTPALPEPIRILVTAHSYSEGKAVLQVAGPLPVVDLFQQGHLNRSQFAPDGFHPNADGYRVWAKLFASQL